MRSNLCVLRDFLLCTCDLYPLILVQWKSSLLPRQKIKSGVTKTGFCPGQVVPPLGRKQSSCNAQIQSERIQGGFTYPISGLN